jgi:hypothetical protein
MSKHIIVLRSLRNVFISAASAAWIWPLAGSIHSALWVLADLKAEMSKDAPPSPFSYAALSQGLMIWALILLAISVFFWTFVVANKLWPIRGPRRD